MSSIHKWLVFGVDVNVALGLNVGGFEIVDVGGGGGDCD